MATNIISEDLMAQINNYGNMHLMIDDIEDHRTTKEANLLAHGTYKTKYGFGRKKRTTKGREVHVKWKDVSGDWLEMKYL